jgi:hypothetical protein
MANLSDIQKSLTNDAVGDLVDSAEFTGVTSYGGGGAESTPNAYGSVSGYSSGSNTPAVSNVIDKYPFSADANATDVGDLTYTRYGSSGANSSTHGYAAGGRRPAYQNAIEKFPFAADGNASDVADLTLAKAHQAGASSSDNGYASGGLQPPYVNSIFKFPFATDANSTDIGDLRAVRGYVAGVSSDDNGYVLGGRSPAYQTSTDKISFASDGNATAAGSLHPTAGRAFLNDQGQNSSTYGYLSGGRIPAYTDDIQKMPFASESPFALVGNLLGVWGFNNGQSSTDNGYVTGGYSPFGPGWAAGVTIQKFPFSTDANSTDVGDLTFGGGYKSGNSY